MGLRMETDIVSVERQSPANHQLSGGADDDNGMESVYLRERDTRRMRRLQDLRGSLAEVIDLRYCRLPDSDSVNDNNDVEEGDVQNGNKQIQILNSAKS